jgi:hypothetical protein
MGTKHQTKRYVLVACEESQAVTKALRKFEDQGILAFSCDLLPCSGERPELHFQQDVFTVIRSPKTCDLQDGSRMKCDEAWNGKWDMMIAHPPCTYLAVSGAQWYYDPKDRHLPTHSRSPHPKYPDRVADREKAIQFFIKLMEANIDRIVIENPIGVVSSRVCKPSQIVQPFMFGDEARKTTCLWLKNVPQLTATNRVGEGERVHFKSGKSQPKWYSDAFVHAKSAEERRTLRSKTFPGMAQAMAKQWSECLNNPLPNEDFKWKGQEAGLSRGRVTSTAQVLSRDSTPNLPFFEKVS